MIMLLKVSLDTKRNTGIIKKNLNWKKKHGKNEKTYSTLENFAVTS